MVRVNTNVHILVFTYLDTEAVEDIKLKSYSGQCRDTLTLIRGSHIIMLYYDFQVIV